ncbi:sugar kinase [Streptomyces iconiensis]|uniref:Sugar kinase n=1 Tax=Streptomyces iconiensis TaxID=1384038 RepID=A0ABT6ZZT0_9ACTN|nr:sugar kinase [Streptomyces iconiensis]MDJ1134585.1 sugar kinase [Streptomyces iconiensis]
MTITPDIDVVCLGESMVTFLPSRSGPLADVPSFDRSIGGAESNVACTLARAGHRARWVSRVGADGFGDHLVRTIAAHGVDTAAVERDPHRPTGIYFRTDGERAVGAAADEPGQQRNNPVRAQAERPLSEVLYYRAGSAASAMSPTNVALEALASGQVLHLTGITAALSDDCRALMRALTGARGGGRPGPLVSFDVNYRVDLWRTHSAERADSTDTAHRPHATHSADATDSAGATHSAHATHSADTRSAGATASADRTGPALLLELARHSDIVFVGEDEAQAVWGVGGGPTAVRDALPEPSVLVVKQGSTGATAFVTGEPAVFAPALSVDVVSPVGAGDAFAAGFLAGTLRGLPMRDRLRHGHLMAAAALTVPGDLAAPPAPAHADRLVALGAEAWETLRLGPGWTSPGPEQEEPEVRSA